MQNKSYLHLAWVPAARIDNSQAGKRKVAQFIKLTQQGEFDEEPFNPAYLQARADIRHAFFSINVAHMLPLCL